MEGPSARSSGARSERRQRVNGPVDCSATHGSAPNWAVHAGFGSRYPAPVSSPGFRRFRWNPPACHPQSRGPGGEQCIGVSDRGVGHHPRHAIRVASHAIPGVPAGARSGDRRRLRNRSESAAVRARCRTHEIVAPAGTLCGGPHRPPVARWRLPVAPFGARPGSAGHHADRSAEAGMDWAFRCGAFGADPRYRLPTYHTSRGLAKRSRADEAGYPGCHHRLSQRSSGG